MYGQAVGGSGAWNPDPSEADAGRYLLADRLGTDPANVTRGQGLAHLAGLAANLARKSRRAVSLTTPIAGAEGADLGSQLAGREPDPAAAAEAAEAAAAAVATLDQLAARLAHAPRSLAILLAARDVLADGGSVGRLPSLVAARLGEHPEHVRQGLYRIRQLAAQVREGAADDR